MSVNLLNQNFDDDEEEEEDDDFRPAPVLGSDDEGGEGDDEEPTRANNRPRVDGDRDDPANGRREYDDEDKTTIQRNGNTAVDADEVEAVDKDALGQDRDEGEDDEGEGEDLDGDEEDDEDEDEEDEDAVGGRPRKRRRRGLNQFFEEEAEVDEEDDDLEAEEEDLGNDGFVADTHPDDLDQLPAGAETDDRRHRELDRRREVEASMDAEKQAQALKERYGRRTATALSSNSFVPQNLLMPSVDDPSIWGIKCKQGKEREVVWKLMKKMLERANSRKPMSICSAFERGSGGMGPMAGYIFVEARRKVDVDDALANLADVYPRTKTNLVPVKEMPDLLRVTKQEELVKDGYVRVKRGLYQGDLAMIEEVESNGLEVTLRLVPRLTYGQDEDEKAHPMVTNDLQGENKRKRLNAFGVVNNIANRPPPRLFSESEAKKQRSGKFLTPARGLTGKSWNYKGDLYENGFLIKDMKLQHLITQDVNPKLDEITKLTRTAADGTETLDLESLAHSLRNNTAEGSYMPGDEVEVYDGEQKGIMGRTEAVSGNIVSIRVTDGELQNQVVDVPMKGLRKRFKEGDHVKVIGGSRYRDEVGMVIKLKDDRVTVLTDASMAEITVFSKDLREATDSGASAQANKFDVQDLLQLDPATVGIVIRSDRESLRVLDQNGSVSTRLPSQITAKVEPRKLAVATDKNGSEIRIGDVVRESGGEGKTGTILNIHRSYLFLHNKTQIEDSGLWTTRCTNVVTTAAKGGRITGPSADLTKMNPALQLKNGANGDMPPPKAGFDKLRGKTVSIRKGPYKGSKGIVKETTDTSARIELQTKNKVINIDKDHLLVLDPVTGKSMDYRSFLGTRNGIPGVMRTGFGGRPAVPDAGFGARTPMADGGRTPAWGSSARTPAWTGSGGSAVDSSRTPAWKGPGGSQTTYGGVGNMTSYGGTGNYGAPGGGRTPAWSSNARTPFGPDHGFAASSAGSGATGFDAFAAGSRTPAYGSSATVTTSRTPAWAGPGLTAPTPGRTSGYDAPTPAANTAPTPGRVFDDDAYTPAYGGAPTPGAGFGPTDAPTPAFAKGATKEPLKYSRFDQRNDAPTPAASAPTPAAYGFDAPTPAAESAGGAPRYLEDSDEGE